jgi:phosphoglycolate phosphatase
MRALLFDLDGTLTKGGGAGGRALGRALQQKPRAVEELKNMRLDGMTDKSIARILLAAEQGQETPLPERLAKVQDSQIEEVLSRYLEMLKAGCQELPYIALPGVVDLLKSLENKSLLGLCTGNLQQGAEIKLRSAGLWGPFKFGGYGSDAEPRAGIVAKAWERAKALGATEALVIGDTPRDILAARDNGLPCCAVATGRYTLRELAEHDPALAIEDFSDVRASERLLLRPLD